MAPTVNNNSPLTCPYCGFVDLHTWVGTVAYTWPIADIMSCVNCFREFAVVFDNEDSEGHVEPYGHFASPPNEEEQP